MTKSFRAFLIIIFLGLGYFIVMEYIYPNTPYCKNVNEELANLVETTPRCGNLGQPVLPPGVPYTGQTCSNERADLITRKSNCEAGAAGPFRFLIKTGKTL